MTEEQRKTFETAARPLIEWLAKNCHPHMTAVVDSNSAALLEGQHVIRTDDYLVD